MEIIHHLMVVIIVNFNVRRNVWIVDSISVTIVQLGMKIKTLIVLTIVGTLYLLKMKNVMMET